LASSTKKREGKAASSLGFAFVFNVVVIISFIGAVPCPWVFDSWRRKRRVGEGLGGLKTHVSVHLVLVLL
jgi:hypothetical protein